MAQNKAPQSREKRKRKGWGGFNLGVSLRKITTTVRIKRRKNKPRRDSTTR